MEIPYTQLSEEALRNLIVDFVSSSDDSGSDLSLGPKIDQVMRQLQNGVAMLTFDEVSGTCGIVKRK